jgi:hypothetical protein
MIWRIERVPPNYPSHPIEKTQQTRKEGANLRNPPVQRSQYATIVRHQQRALHGGHIGIENAEKDEGAVGSVAAWYTNEIFSKRPWMVGVAV